MNILSIEEIEKVSDRDAKENDCWKEVSRLMNEILVCKDYFLYKSSKQRMMRSLRYRYKFYIK